MIGRVPPVQINAVIYIFGGCKDVISHIVEADIEDVLDAAPQPSSMASAMKK
jgi:hypothetical protein